MALTRNNFLMYLANLYTIGGVADDQAAAGILSRFDYIVITMHTGPDLPRLREILQAYRVMNPKGKAFGYTDLGGATDLAAWQAEVDAWDTALNPTNSVVTSAAPLLKGIFIDNFGAEFANCTRVNQNAAVDYVHALNWAAMVRPSKVYDAFDVLGTDVAPTFGKTAAIRDYVLMDDFWFVNANATTLTAESQPKREGRFDYVRDVLTTTALGNPTGFNVGVVAQMGAGDNTDVLEADWLAALAAANGYRVEAFGVAPHDFGVTTNRYFYKFTADLFE